MSPNDPPVKKIGRPAIAGDAPSTRIGFRLAPREADALYARAQREQVTVSELLRRAARGGFVPQK